MNKIFSLLLSTLIVIFHCTLSYAQENHAKKDSSFVKKRFIHFGAGAGYVSVKDQSISPIIHSGPSISGSWGVQFQSKPNSQNIFYVLANSASIVAEKGNERVRSVGSSSAFTVITYSGYMHLRKIKSQSTHFQFYAGGDARLAIQFRSHVLYTNSGQGGEGNISIGPVGKITYTFDWVHKKKPKVRTHDVNFILGVPLIGYSLTTAYAIPLNIDRNLESNFSFIGKYTMLNSRMEFVKHLVNGNRWGVSYNWNFYTHRYLNIVESADHSLGVFVQFGY